MSAILSANTVMPANVYSQYEISEVLSDVWGEHAKAAKRFHDHSKVETRNLALKLEQYKSLGDFGSRNDLWIKHAVPLATKAVTNALAQRTLQAKDIDLIISTSITGIAVPSLEARLMNLMNFKDDTKRMPLFGLGCLGGAACVARAHDYLMAYPTHAVLITATELCSLTFQLDDQSIANMVATGLFADGSAAVVMVGKDHEKYKDAKMTVIGSMSAFYPETERIMGWDINQNGFKIVLSGDVPALVQEKVPSGVKKFLDRHQYHLSDIGEVIAHPGGPKVLDALTKALDVDSSWLRHSWESLAKNGNMSSVSVLDILSRTLKTSIDESKLGILMAMGPAFCSEMVLTKRVP